MRASYTDTSQKEWYRFLVQHTYPNETELLATYLIQIATGNVPNGSPPISTELTSGAGKLLGFYIWSAFRSKHPWDRSSPDDIVCIGEALADKSLIAVRENLRLKRKEGETRNIYTAEKTDALLESASLDEAIRLVYLLSVGRSPADQEISTWRNNLQSGLEFHDFLLLMYKGEESLSFRAGGASSHDQSDGDFVVKLYRIILGRGCNGYEIDGYRRLLEDGGISRPKLLDLFFGEAAKADRLGTDYAVHDGLSCQIMGTQKFLTLAEWQNRATSKAGQLETHSDAKLKTPFVVSGPPRVKVSAIASLYRGGQYIERFLDNITSQTIFDKYCELIIVDANSPENEAETISRYASHHPSIRYYRADTRIGIYEAWNIGIELSSGEYLTNTNLDDLRRRDSLEIQAGALDSFPFVDVVYQEFYYSFDPTLSWDEVSSFGYISNLPIVTPHNLLRFNSPHNAPMWRRALHQSLGGFDASLKSAGDYEFWLRCLVNDKTFFKINEPHVVYYQNPNGLSTRADTRGVVEGKEVTRKYTPMLMPTAMTCSREAFLRSLNDPGLDADSPPSHDRFAVTQRALRELARRSKRESV